MNTEIPFFILSAESDIKSENENAYRDGMLTRQLRTAGFATARCRGVYKGQAEVSVLVIDETPSTDACFDAVIRLARTYHQESILAVDANRCATLIYTDIRRLVERVGKFTAVTEPEAKGLDAWTERAGRYYVCKL